VTEHILIVDNMEAFATILKEGIQGGGDYQAEVVTTALEARNVAAREHLALAIVDMGLEDEDPIELLKTLRERHPDLRLMVIPLGEVPAEVLDLGIQGTLPKPFFLPDIPAQIEEALGRGVGAPLIEQEPPEMVAEAPVPSQNCRLFLPKRNRRQRWRPLSPRTKCVLTWPMKRTA